jgi:molecular chaperone GrpE
VQNETNQRAEEQKEQVSGAPEPDKLTSAPDEAAPTERADEAPEAERADGEAPADAAEEPAEEPAAQAEEAEEVEGAEAEEVEGAEEAEEASPQAETEPEPEPAPSPELAAARAEAEAYLDDLRRLQAEFDNYRKRVIREQTARATSASQALVARLLPVLDNFELAVSSAEQSRDFDRMLKGVEMVFGELREVLQGEGLVKIEAEGKPFDPERHEAVVAVEQEGVDPGTVVDVVRTGYELRGRVLRPAMVKVAR